MPVARAALDEPADLVAGVVREKDVGHHQVRVHVLQADQRRLAIGDGYDFEAFLAQDPLSHALGMGAVVSQENPAHLLVGGGF